MMRCRSVLVPTASSSFVAEALTSSLYPPTPLQALHERIEGHALLVLPLGKRRKILGILAQPVLAAEHELFVTGSLGISLFPADGTSCDELMKAADAAMYKAKQEGKNIYQFYTPDMNARAHELLLLEGDLRKAIEFEQMVLHYQPQFELAGGRLIGMEALVRWRHPRRGLVPPADFIPLAEETGLIVSLGEWVLRQACLQNRAWQQQGLPPVRMAVNISARQFRQPDFVDLVDRILAETGLAAECLELEITESVVMEDFSEAIMTLTDLKVRGIHLSIDDFGTGYSSLNYLKQFPISKLKIDQDFVRDVTVDANDAAIAASVIALAQSMNLEVIAEGVETVAHGLLLLQLGCNLAQGYGIAQPMPAEALAGWLADWRPDPRWAGGRPEEANLQLDELEKLGGKLREQQHTLRQSPARKAPP